MARIFVCMVLLLVMTTGIGSAAEIRLLDNNPVIGEDYQFLNVAKRYNGFGSFEGNGRVPKKSSLLEVTRENKWAFDKGLGLDGGHSYESIHLRATWSSLPSSRIVEVSGEIRRGDTDRLKALVKELNFSNCLRENYCPFNNTIAFDSKGGNLVEAIKMGEYITSQSFATLVDNGAVCESACVFAMLAGFTHYESFFFPRRYVHKGAKVGIHQPYFQLPDQSYSVDDVQNVVNVVNAGVIAATRYLLRVGVGFRFLKKMYETPPQQMYYLNSADMENDDIFILGKNQKVSEISRREFFSYCSNVYIARYSEANADLLHNLQSSGSEFLTFVNGKEFACFGVKRLKQDTWYAETCFDAKCQLSAFGQAVLPVAQPSDNNKTAVLWDIAVDIDNGSVGYALNAYSRRSAILKYLRLYAEHHDFTTMEAMTTLAVQNPIAKAFCDKIDGYDPGLILQVQDRLNRSGIDVGKPDGAAGPNTRKGIKTFNKQKTGRDLATIDALTLTAMGFDQSVISQYKLCPTAD